MRIFLKAFIGATAIHVVYFVTTFTVGYVKTVNYKPDWKAAWTNVENLQNEVAFGYTLSPFMYVVSFLATVVACGIILRSHEKRSSISS